MKNRRQETGDRKQETGNEKGQHLGSQSPVSCFRSPVSCFLFVFVEVSKKGGQGGFTCGRRCRSRPNPPRSPFFKGGGRNTIQFIDRTHAKEALLTRPT